jgi:hypothetical protein
MIILSLLRSRDRPRPLDTVPREHEGEDGWRHRGQWAATPALPRLTVAGLASLALGGLLTWLGPRLAAGYGSGATVARSP